MKNLIPVVAASLFLLVSCQPEQSAESPDRVTRGGVEISGPYSHGNLDVYLIHGEDKAEDLEILTLDEAMESGAVVVHETGDVNQLRIENKSKDAYVFVHSGDILKGGKQDRTVPNSLVLAPNSAPTPVASFCVEQSRWEQRGAESLSAFNGAYLQLNSKDLKLAARLEKDQGKVWSNVIASQAKLSQNVYEDGGQVNAQESPTSLQLALENKDVQAATKLYVDGIKDAIGTQEDVVGYAFAVNGKFNSGDTYLSRSLFAKLWPRRLEAAASEALAEADGAGEFERIEPAALLGAMQQANEVQPRSEKLAGDNQVNTRETNETVRFDACYRQKGRSLVVHENVIAK